MKHVAFALAALAAAACTKHADGRDAERDRHQAVLGGVAVECGLPPSTAKRRADQSLYILIPVGTPLTVVECIRRQIHARYPANLRVVDHEPGPASTMSTVAAARPDMVRKH